MAKRKKRKHRPSAKYLLFASKSKPTSIIPTITKKPTKSADYKQIRNEIRKAFSDQKQVKIETPSKTYTSNRKKNRKEARQRRKEKKQKRKQQQQPKQSPQPEPEPTTWQDADRDEDYRTETLDYDDTDNYIEDLISMIQTVSDTLQETYGKWYMGTEQWLLELNKLEYWLEEALQLPYDSKIAICNTLEGNSYLEEVRNVMHLEHYKEVEQSIVAVTDEIISIIESAY